MEARIITDRQQWNDFIAASPYCNITQSFEWGELASNVGAKPLHVGVLDDDGQLCAAVLVFVSRMPVLRRIYLYAPRGPILSDPDGPAMTLLLNFIKSEARKYHAFMLKFEPGVEDDNAAWVVALRRRGFHATTQVAHVQSEWVLDIRPDEKALLAGMKEKWRYNIRLAARKGVTIRRGEGQADLDTFYRIHQQTSERDGFFIHDKAHYELFMHLYGEDERAVIFLAEYQGEAIAATVVLRFGHWSWYMYGASSDEHRNVMPNHLLQWTGMQWAKSHGCWYYNFRGIPDVLQEGEDLWGVYLFKRGFGGYATHALPGQELPYNPLVYQLYCRMLDVKRWRDERRKPEQSVAVAAKGGAEEK